RCAIGQGAGQACVTVEWTTRKLVDIVEHEIAGREHGRSIPRIFAEHIAAPPTSFARHPFLFLLADEAALGWGEEMRPASSSRCSAARRPTGARDQRVDLVAGKLTALDQRLRNLLDLTLGRTCAAVSHELEIVVIWNMRHL